MTHKQIIRAWKDPKYRRTLSAAERAALPANPAGLVELSDEQLQSAAGGAPAVNTTKCTVTKVCSTAKCVRTKGCTYTSGCTGTSTCQVTSGCSYTSHCSNTMTCNVTAGCSNTAFCK